MPANYVLLERITLTSTATSVVLDNIPQTGYTDLKIVWSARGTDNTSYNYITFNGGVGSGRLLYAETSAPTVASFTQTVIQPITSQTYPSVTANTFANCEMYIPNYSVSGVAKSIFVDGVTTNNSSSGILGINAYITATTSPITTITIKQGGSTDTGNFLAGSSFSLYGIAALGVTPTVVPKASGGDIIVNDGTYWYHAFLASGIFSPASNLTADVLVVAGAGGGGSSYGGGGGGGGFQEFTSQDLIATPYTCTIGAGGVGGNSATNGGNSQFGALTASVGGGFGGKNPPVNGNSGGSGGGGRGDNSAPGVGTGGAATSGQGFAGGNGAITKSAGGGGAGSAGANGASGGSNGWGKSSVITGGATTGLGVLFSGSYYLAAGGVGVGTITPTIANGGVAAYATPPTGSGTGTSEGTNAASGVVVIRYTMA